MSATLHLYGGAPTDGGQAAGGDEFAPAIDAAPVQINPYETPEQHDRGGKGSRSGGVRP
ncbi:MAG TPA: hypothetical protein VF477_02255 [Mycobacterium sp.]